jgi:hypothetical protein
VFDAVFTELHTRFGPALPVTGVVVVVEVEAARPVISPAYTFDPAATVETVRRQWLANYGVAPRPGQEEGRP